MNQTIKLLALAISVFLTGYFFEETIDSSKSNIKESLEDTFELLAELFSVFVAISIFTITWFAYNKSRDNHSLFLGTVFLTTGLLILLHVLSYPFMPDFITPNLPYKSAIFLTESRFIVAILLLISVYVHQDSLSKLINKRIMILFVIVILSFSLYFIFFYDNIFVAYNFISNPTMNVATFFVVSVVILIAGHLYMKRAKKTGENNLNYLTYGSIIVCFSNLVYFFYEFSGHFLIITGFSYFFLGLYKSSVELPYEKLAIAEKNLHKEIENNYHNLFDNANDAIITTDLENKITLWNRSAENFFGWEAQEMAGKKLSRLIIPLNMQTRIEGIISDSMNGSSAVGIETICLRKDGTNLFMNLTTSQLLDSNRNIVGLSFMLRDITEHKKAEDLLKKSKKFAETVINSMNDAISVIDINNFKIKDVNSALLDRYGIKKEDVIGKTCYEITHKRAEPCVPPDIICPLMDTLKTGKTSTVEHIHYSVNGGKQYVEVTTTPINDENGNIVNVIYVARDITERKRNEEKIKTSLYEKETLLREIHHRVKNNMQIVSSLLDHQTQYIEDKKMIDIFTESQNRIVSMALVHEKLYQSKDLGKIDFDNYINDLSINLFQSYEIQSGNIKLNMELENINLDIDFAIPCGLIINELVTNAIKYAFPSSTKGEIKITFRRIDENMLELVVGDNGTGIPKDMDFRKTNSLGLHLVTILSENQLHGEISLDRSKGTVFQIKFRGIK